MASTTLVRFVTGSVLAAFASTACSATQDEGTGPSPAAQARQEFLDVSAQATTNPGPVPEVVGGSNAALGIGGVDASVSRYPDPSDTQRLVFTLTPQQFAALRTGDDVTVSGGGTAWQLGQLQL